MKTCTYCGAESEDATNYCPGCGTDFSPAENPIQRFRRLFRILRLTKRKVRLMLATAFTTSAFWAIPWSNWLKLNSPSPASMSDYFASYYYTDAYEPTVRFASGGTTTIHCASSHWEPTILATMNGVTNLFVVDTGAACPMLSLNGARSFNVPLSPLTAGNWTNQFPLSFPVETRVARNVTVEVAPGVTVFWPRVVVEMTNRPWAGLLDFRTLHALNAIIDVNNATITVSATKPNSNLFKPSAITGGYGGLTVTNTP